MADSKPQLNVPSELAATSIGEIASLVAAPTAAPPEELALATASGNVAALATNIAAASFTSEAAAFTGATAVAAAATTWVNGKKINALWSINENRNSWVGVTGVGWVKLANNSDTAIVAFTMLGANARNTQGTVNYRQESDGMIHEIYVW
ncbi:MAG TPA: hypothetical protein VGB69_13020 [Edaphobacter sp.]